MLRARLILVAALALAVAIVSIVVVVTRDRLSDRDEPAPVSAQADRLPSLEPASGWLNGGPITADSLRGRPALLVLWSDTDPRCLRTLADVEARHQAFARYGLRVVGVYAPDYSFGADPAVPTRVARKLGLGFPIALDPGYRIAFGAGAEKPALAVADSSGRIVLRCGGDRIGEADRTIRDLLRHLRPAAGFPFDPAQAREASAASWSGTRLAFLGTARAGAGPLADAAPGRTLTFTSQFRFQEEGEPFVPFPVGRWTTSAEGLTAARAGAMTYIAIRFRGGLASVIMAPPPGGKSRVWVLEDDGWMPEGSRAEDVVADRRGATYVDVSEPRLYSLARTSGVHVLRLSPEDPGVTLYAFVFEPLESAGAGSAPAANGRR